VNAHDWVNAALAVLVLLGSWEALVLTDRGYREDEQLEGERA
jgi:hypothetical protein